MGIEDDTGDLAIGDWERRWRLCALGVEMTVETYLLGIGDESGDCRQI